VPFALVVQKGGHGARRSLAGAVKVCTGVMLLIALGCSHPAAPARSATETAVLTRAPPVAVAAPPKEPLSCRLVLADDVKNLLYLPYDYVHFAGMRRRIADVLQPLPPCAGGTLELHSVPEGSPRAPADLELKFEARLLDAKGEPSDTIVAYARTPHGLVAPPQGEQDEVRFVNEVVQAALENLRNELGAALVSRF
jgi:hypothetical protein